MEWTHCEICLNKMAVQTQFRKRGILNKFPSPRLVYLDNYAGHMRNFTGSVDCWGFQGEQGQAILSCKGGEGCLA